MPGFIDWAKGIPRRSAAKKTGLIHMALNVSALAVLFVNVVIGLSAEDAKAGRVSLDLRLTAAGGGAR